MANYITTPNSCTCPDRKFRKGSKAACKHMERALIEQEMNEADERAIFELNKQDVVMYQATTENEYLGDWCGCSDYLEFGFDCVHLSYLKRNNLKTWKDVTINGTQEN